MTLRTSVAFACLAVALVAKNARGQTCRGRPGFTKAKVVANAGAMMASDARSTSAGLTIGSRGEGLVASVAAGRVVREVSSTFDSDQTGTSLGASIAYAGTEAGGRLELCPGLGISQIKVSGDFVTGGRATLTQTSRRAGVSAGYTLPASPSLLVIPFATVERVWFGGSVKGEGVDFPVPEDTYIPVTVGLGTVWKDRVGMTAAMIIPTGLPTPKTSFLTTLSLALGGR